MLSLISYCLHSPTPLLFPLPNMISLRLYTPLSILNSFAISSAKNDFAETLLLFILFSPKTFLYETGFCGDPTPLTTILP